MRTLNQRLIAEVTMLENKYNIRLSDSQKNEIVENQTVGYTVMNTYDKAVENIENYIKSLLENSKAA